MRRITVQKRPQIRLVLGLSFKAFLFSALLTLFLAVPAAGGPAATVTARVFDDVNGNGVEDAGERELRNVAIKVTDSSAAEQTLKTGTSGDISAVVPPGATTCDLDETTLPPGHALTTANDPDTVTAVDGASVACGPFGSQARSTVIVHVFDDVNGDGGQGAGEPDLAGVDVRVIDAAAGVTAGTTDARGDAVLSVVPGPATCDVDEGTLPASYALTTLNDPQQITAAVGAVTCGPFGYQPRGTVSVHIFSDTNGDGTEDNGEPGLAGIDIEIADSFGLLKKAVTDALGDVFVDVPAGITAARVVGSTLPADHRLTTANDPQTLTATVGATVAFAAFGFQAPPELGTVTIHVFEDLDGDGTQSAGEAPISGVYATVTDSFGAVLTVSTDAVGNAAVAVPGGPASCDVIDSTAPAGAALTTANDPQTVTSTAGAAVACSAFGFAPAPRGTLIAHIFEDLDGDGAQGVGEPDFAGIGVAFTDSFGGAQPASTDPQGDASASVLAGPVTGDVDETTLPPGYVLTTANDPQTVMVAAGMTVTLADFGFQPPAFATARLFLDLDGDGAQGVGEPGLAGIDVTLTDANGAQAQTSDTLGDVVATVAPGAIALNVIDAALPAGFVLTTSNDPQGATAAAGVTVAFTDLGWRPVATATAHLFEDLDGDGVQDVFDPDLTGVSVVLTGSDGVAQTPASDALGDVLAGVPGGLATADVIDSTLPSGYVLTTSNDPQTAFAVVGAIVPFTDFGYRPPPASVAAHVFEDRNGNGVQDPLEPSLAGVDVELTDSTGARQTATSDVLGDLSFSAPPGQATGDVVDTTLPAGFTLTTANDPQTVTTQAGATAALAAFGYCRDTDGDGVCNVADNCPALANLAQGDQDGDGLGDACEGCGADRDGDGVDNCQDFDPTGFAGYCEGTGEIVPGGFVTVLGPGNVQLFEDGADGTYRFVVDAPGRYDLIYTPPLGYSFSTDCLDLGVLDPSGRPDPYVLGAGAAGGSGILTSGSCVDNPFYLAFELEEGDPFVLNNNIPLICLSTPPPPGPPPIPTLSQWGFLFFTLLLAFGGVGFLRRAERVKKGFLGLLLAVLAAGAPSLEARAGESSIPWVEITLELRDPSPLLTKSFLQGEIVRVERLRPGYRPRPEERLTLERLVIAAVDRDGAELARRVVGDPLIQHAEVFDPATGGHVHSEARRFEKASMFVILPEMPRVAALRVLRPTRIGEGGNVDLDLLSVIPWEEAGATAAVRPRRKMFDTIRDNGDSANRIDLAILGDGYALADQAKYATDVNNALNGFFALEPFSAYEKFFNVHRVEVISNDSGVDNGGILKDTALDGHYDCGGCSDCDRLICVDKVKTLAAASAVLAADERDILMVIINDSEYGGSGDSGASAGSAVAVFSTDASATRLALHEMGHTLGDLADEYVELSRCTPGEPGELNSTAETDRALIKWTDWIAATTAVPTAQPNPVPAHPHSTPGLYEGSRYCPTMMYRPTLNSMMRVIDRPFDAINEDLLIRRFYQFGPTPIDEHTPSSLTINLTPSQSEPFSVKVIPTRDNTIEVSWFLDGSPVATGLAYTLHASALSAGLHTLEARAVDNTAKVRPDPTAGMKETVVWTVTLGAALPAVPANLGSTNVGSTSFTATWDASPGATSYELQRWTGAWTDVPGSTSATSRTFTGLPAGGYQYFKVRAVNAAGRSAYSQYHPIKMSTCSGGPPVPASLAASDVQATSFTLSWSPSAGATSYDIERWVGGWADAGSTSSTSHPLSGLPQGSTQYVHVRAVGACGVSQFSSYLTVDLSTCSGGPPAPSGLAATHIQATSFTLTWSPSAGAMGYDVERWNGSGWEAGGSANSTSLALNGLSSGSTQYVRVRAENACGEGPWSAFISVPLTACTDPPTPTGLAATDLQPTSFTAVWDPSPNATNYDLQLWNGTGWDDAASTSSTFYTFTGFPSGSLQYVQVRAINSCGESLYSGWIPVDLP